MNWVTIIWTMSAAVPLTLGCRATGFQIVFVVEGRAKLADFQRFGRGADGEGGAS